jgi:Flp pilus assembly protein TadD
VLISLGLEIALLGMAAWAVVRTRDGRGGPPLARLAALGTFWFFLTLSVESSVVPLLDLLVEHRMYLPSVGFFLAVSSLAFMLRDRVRRSYPGAARTVFPLLLVAAAIFAVAAHERNALWGDSVSLWEDAARKSPDRPRVRLELGRHYTAHRRFEEGAREVMAAIRLKPGDAEAWNNLGVLRRQQGRADEALSSYRMAIELRPGFAEVHHNIGLLLASEGRLEEAAEEFGEALRLKPGSADVHNALGITWARLGRMPDAVREFQEAVRIDPTHAGARSNLARASGAMQGR